MGTKSSNDYYKFLAECNINMLRDLGFSLEKDMKILDFGCGEGNLVNAYSELGYDIYGADIIDNDSLEPVRYKKIEFDPYHIPYDDNSFDFVYSTSVFEHVQNTEESFREIHRVLKPGGVSTHSLPSRYRLLEPHLYIPLGGVLHPDFWVKFWAFAGVRNEFQKGLPWREVYQRNIGFYETALNYMSYADLKKIVESVFGNIKAVKKEYIKNSPGGAAKLGRMLPIPGYGSLIFFFREWELYMIKE